MHKRICGMHKETSEAQTYTLREALITVVWIAWVLSIGIVEALIRILFKKVYLIIEEDEWSVSMLILR